jgi:dipeptidyl aminopeptidase/acylaminoacyl peptidase
MSPSGRHVALVANRSPLVAASTDNDIELIDVRTGKRSVVSNLDGSDAAPRFSPDGETLAWASMSRPGYESDKRVLRLASVDGDAGALISVDEPDLSVADFKFLPDGRSVVFTAQHQGRMGLWKLPLEGGSSAPAQLVGGGRVSSFAVAPDGRFLAFVMESAVSAPEIFRIDLGPRIAGTPLRLSAHNDELWGDLALGAVGELRFEGAGGDEVHAWVVEPPAPARPSGGAAPVLWLVHGGPQGAWLDDQHPRWNMQQFAALGYLVVAVNFHGSTGYGQPFTDSINRDWGGKPFEDLMLGIDAAAEAYPAADFDRVCALGGSYGGYMVNWMLGHASDRFRCFVSHAGVYDLKSMYGATEELWFPEWDLGGPFWENAELYERLSPSTYAAQFDTPTLVIHGQLDFRVPVTQGMQLFTALQRRGVPSRFLYYPDEGHWILTPANALLWWTTIEDWLEQWLESPAPAD